MGFALVAHRLLSQGLCHKSCIIKNLLCFFLGQVVVFCKFHLEIGSQEQSFQEIICFFTALATNRPSHIRMDGEFGWCSGIRPAPERGTRSMSSISRAAS